MESSQPDRRQAENAENANDTQGNADYPWDDFDSSYYFQHNYSKLRADDAQILEAVREFFLKVDRSGGAGGWSDGRPARGLDVGSGTNLYPALAMLPFCGGGLTLWEYSARNVGWLRREIGSYSPSWDRFWERLTVSSRYRAIVKPRDALAALAQVQQASIFDLPVASWDIGTMFFVAESLTADKDEFQHATRCFIRALRPGAPFAAAFMENSLGYPVGDRDFPAVAVTVDAVRQCLEEFSDNLDVRRVEVNGDPLRDGYTGMILALGTVAPVAMVPNRPVPARSPVDPASQLVQHYQDFRAGASASSSLVAQLADDEVRRTADFLRDLNIGVVRYDGEDRDCLLTLARNAKRCIDAISLATVDAHGSAFDGSFWQSDLGQRYLRIQEDLVAKTGETDNPVKIRRIFVIDTPSVRNRDFWRDFLAMCRAQARMRIEVRILEAAAGPGVDLRFDAAPGVDLRFDFVVFDNIIVYETKPHYHGDVQLPRMLRTQLECRSNVVTDRIDEYQTLWLSATPLEEYSRQAE